MSAQADAVRDAVMGFINSRTSNGYEAGETLGARNMDSLDIVELVIDVEGRWGVSIPDDLWSHDTPVERVVTDVQRVVGVELGDAQHG